MRYLAAEDIDMIPPRAWDPVATASESAWAARRYARAFPASLANKAASVFLRVPIGMGPSGSETAVVGDDVLAIPTRIYNPTVPVRSIARDEVEQCILYCIYTRHHDGRVHQRAVERLVESTEPWVVPFVVRLVGEYVIEIVESVRVRLDLADPATRAQYGSVVAENPELLDLTTQRAISYWNCYYRGRYPIMRPGAGSAFETYPAFRVLESLREAAAG